MRSNMTQKFKHGEVWLVNLHPARGTIIPGKTRPALIIQNQALLDVEHPSTFIIPLTTRLVDDAAPLRLRLNAKDKLEKHSDLLIDQIRAIDNRKLIAGPLLVCDESFMKCVYRAVQEIMGFSN